MKRIAEVYGRALFPRRYGSRIGADVDGQPAALVFDGLDLSVAAGVYRLVSAVEALLYGIRRRTRTRSRQTPVVSPVGCG